MVLRRVCLAVAWSLAVAAPAAALAPGVEPAPSHRWAGFVVSAPRVSYTSVSATWTQPALTCPRGGPAALSTIWVGLGGYGRKSGALEQVGTDANCDAAGRARAFAWFELLPDIAHAIDGTVAAGDTISASVRVVELNVVQLRLRNVTRHWSFRTEIKVGLPDTASAEWIVEAPYSCVRFACRAAPLANFGSISVQHVAAVGNGSTGTLTSRGWRATPLLLVPCSATGAAKPGAVPGGAASDGTSFDVRWVRRAEGPSRCAHGDGGSLGGLPDYTTG